MGETGPIYGVTLIDTLPLPGGMSQQMASRRDLDLIVQDNERVVAAYEVALATIDAKDAKIAKLEAELTEARGVLSEASERVTCEISGKDYRCVTGIDESDPEACECCRLRHRMRVAAQAAASGGGA